MPKHQGMSEEPGSLLQQLGWAKLTAVSKDDRAIQEFGAVITLEDIQSKLFCKRDGRFANSALDLSDTAYDLISTGRKTKRKPRAVSSALSSKANKPAQLSAADAAKTAMAAQDAQMLDKMENVAYRLTSQAVERTKHMNSRGVFGEEQNALRARSAQRVQLWKGLHPSALSEAVSHFTKSQKLQQKSSITRSGTIQSRTEKACLNVLGKMDADLPLSAVQGDDDDAVTLDAHAAGKLTGTRLDTAMADIASRTLDAHAAGKLTSARLDTAIAGIASECATKAKLRNLSPEQDTSLKLSIAAAKAERVQQYQEMVAQQSQAVMARAHTHRADSNVAVLAEQLSSTQDTQLQHAREEEEGHLTASGPALLEAVVARIKAAEERLFAARLQRGGGRSPGLRAGALVPTLSTFPQEGFPADEEDSPAAPSPLALSPRAVAPVPRRVDYEYGKAYDRQDAAKYFGGMQGMRTQSGHAMFRPASAKTWESGQRPRNLAPHEMPWARSLPSSSSLRPQKSVAKALEPAASTLASLTSEASLDAAMLAQEEARKEEELRRVAAAQQAQQTEHKSAPSILDQPWAGPFQLPSREEVGSVPMPGLPNVDPPSARTQFDTIAQYLQVRLERVWGILQTPVTSKLDWVIKYTGEQGSGLFEPALQAWEQAAAAVLERERLLLQLSQIQQQLVQPEQPQGLLSAQGQEGNSLSAQVDRLSICFVIATVQVEAAAQMLQEVFEEPLLYQGTHYPGVQALTLQQLEHFIARVHAFDELQALL